LIRISIVVIVNQTGCDTLMRRSGQARLSGHFPEGTIALVEIDEMVEPRKDDLKVLLVGLGCFDRLNPSQGWV